MSSLTPIEDRQQLSTQLIELTVLLGYLQQCADDTREKLTVAAARLAVIQQQLAATPD